MFAILNLSSFQQHTPYTWGHGEAIPSRRVRDHTMLAETFSLARRRSFPSPAAWTASASAQNLSASCRSFFSVSNRAYPASVGVFLIEWICAVSRGCAVSSSRSSDLLP